MLETAHAAENQIERINARIAQLAADHRKSKIMRAAWLDAGDARRANQLTARLRTLTLELAYLASQKMQWERSHSRFETGFEQIVH